MSFAFSPSGLPGVSDLTDEQRRAVQWDETDLCVDGGPGSGKTAVLLRRVERLVTDEHVEPERVAVFASSPPAARSLEAALSALLPEVGDRLHVSTLPATCAQILRKHGSQIGLDLFSIYNEPAARAVVQREMEEHGYGPESEDPDQVLREIARVKGGRESADPGAEPLHCGEELIRVIYPAYQAALERARALDGPDLTRHTRHLFEESEALLGQYRSHWISFHIDDFHNLTAAERSLLTLLAGPSSDVFATTDENQRLRGSSIQPAGTEDFWAERPEKERIVLRRSFRPPEPILALAASLTENLPGHNRRFEAVVSTPAPGATGEEEEEGHRGSPAPRRATTALIEADSSDKERRAIAQRIEWLCEEGAFSYEDVLVLARRPDELLPVAAHFEEEGIPAVLDPRPQPQEEEGALLSYLQVAANPHDDRRLLRIINTPSRGIGPKTKARVTAFARNEGVSVWEALHRLGEIDSVTGSPQRALREFRHGMVPFVERAQSAPPSEWARELVEESGFLQSVTRGNTREHLARQERVEALLKRLEASERPHASIHPFLDEAWLAGTPASAEGRVRLMPVEAARGLEAPIVFLLGLEEGLFPRADATGRALLLAQERRAFYVGLARAQERLFLSWAKTREEAADEPSARSRFLDDLDPGLYEIEPVRPSAQGPSPTDVPASYTGLDPHYYRDNLRAQQQDPTAAPNPTEEEANRIHEGLRVKHAKMGEGTVLHAEGEGEKRIAIVRFDERGEKKLQLRYAPLTVVGETDAE
jgi:DNA helicase-2/ATP-dependent DNA helicase PcrA